MAAIEQRSAAPTAKTWAGGASGAVVVCIIWVAHQWGGVDIPPEVAAALVGLITFAASYIKAPRWKDQIQATPIPKLPTAPIDKPSL